jgi:hypothetical protein
MKYLVTWHTRVWDAKSPEHAAKKALADIRRRGSMAHIFDVSQVVSGAASVYGPTVRVDLNEGKSEVV